MEYAYPFGRRVFGYGVPDRAIYPAATRVASIKAMQKILHVLKKFGTPLPRVEHMVSFQEAFKVLRFSNYMTL